MSKHTQNKCGIREKCFQTFSAENLLGFQHENIRFSFFGRNVFETAERFSDKLSGGAHKAPSKARTQRVQLEYRAISHAEPS